LAVRPIRRIVTGNDARGFAVVVSDGPTPHLRTSPGRPGVAFTNVWTTDRMPADASQTIDPVTPAMGLAPPRNGTNFRIVEFGPEREHEPVDPEAARKAFVAMGAAEHALAGGPAPRHPFMHETPTLDYGIVLSGEITLVLDDSEILMRAGDVCIQRATNHAWSNRSSAPCVMAFVLIDALSS